MKRAFVFPGQGSQHPGMGRDLAEAFQPARLLFEEVDDALSQRLSRLMFDGPESDLTLTENAQPALLAASLAVIRVLRTEAGFDLANQIAYVAGHSLGEYSAHAAAGTVSVADAVRLVKRRGQAMQKAVPVGDGAMAALFGLETEAAREVAAGTSRLRHLRRRQRQLPGPDRRQRRPRRGRESAAAELAAEARGARSCCWSARRSICPLMALAAAAMEERARRGIVEGAARAGRRQRHRCADHRPRRRSRIRPTGADHPHGDAGARPCCCFATRSRRSSRPAPAACWPGRVKRDRPRIAGAFGRHRWPKPKR